MTKAEAIKRIQQDRHKGAYGDGDYYADYAENLIDEIYDNFKSRICKNCKYFDDNKCTNKVNTQICDNGEVWGQYMQVKESFGCNRFDGR